MIGSYERLLIAAAMWACLGFALFLLRRQSPLNLCVLTVISTALVGAFYPVATVFVEASSWRNLTHARESLVQGIQFEYLAFAVGLTLAVVGAWLAGRLRTDRVRSSDGSPLPPPDVGSDPRTRHRDTWVSLVMLGFGGILYGLYVQKVGLDALTNREDYAEKYLLSRGLGPLFFGLNLMMAACLWAEASRIAPTLKWAFRAVAGALVVWSLVFLSVRTNVVILAVGYAWVLCRDRRLEVARVRLSVLALMVVLYGVMECFSLYRGATQEVGADGALALIGRYAEDSVSSVVGGSELSHPFLTTMEVASYEIPGELEGRSYVDAFLAYLPKAINPEAPRALSEIFVANQYADLDERGGGTAFSIVAEAWWNFGSVLGPLLVGFLIGCVLLGLETWSTRHPASVFARLVPYCVYLVAIVHRSEFGVLVKQGLTIFLVPMAVVYAVELVWLARAPRAENKESRRWATN